MAYQFHSERGFPLPAVTKGQRNGELPDNVLVSLPAPAVGRMTKSAARAFAALQAAYHAGTGGTLGVTSAADAYRSRAVQVGAFAKRYVPKFDAATCQPGETRIGPDGKTWYLLNGHAALAGFDKNGDVISLHGWGVGCDLKDCTKRKRNDAWLEAHAAEFGFYKSSAKEPWHYFLVTGDTPTAAVLAFEAGHGGDVGPTIPPDPVHTTKPTLRIGSTGPDVVLVQKAVGAKPDGQFGPKTQAAVMTFQAAHGLVQDGIVGPQTWKYIA